MDRRHFLKLTGATTLAVASGSMAQAAWKPRRPLNIIVPYKAGGGTDLYARALAAAAQDRIPVPLVIVNKPGAGGMTGAIAAAQARPDGNTIMMHSTGSFLLRHMFQETEVGPFDSFQTIAQIGNLKGSLVVPASSPFQTVEDVVEALKAAPGTLRWGHNGRGATYHALGQTFLNTLELGAVDVPFKGGAASRAALIGAQVDFGFIGIQQAKGFESDLRVLAVADTVRDDFQPDVPTFAEAGFDVPIISSPIMLFAPNGVDPEIVAGIEEALKEIVAAPEFAELLAAKGTLPLYRTGAEAEAMLRDVEAAAQPVIDALKATQ
ncbi:Bug family tripartite tricarboxylate transporter substrate binding protein [Aliiroseovarius sp.]|uniref:Bug family tripartite tricarboxylate transporter substrate binding protein n=1 Tax=Aliiroseovarius sp. TaxID=1872442 RepID=UPI003BA869B5